VALSHAQRRQLLAESLPEANEVRLQLRDYLARTGMTPPDFAHGINYAQQTLYFFLNGRYSKVSANECSIRAAIREFIAAHPRSALLGRHKLCSGRSSSPRRRSGSPRSHSILLKELWSRKLPLFLVLQSFSRPALMLPEARLAEPYRRACFLTQARSRRTYSATTALAERRGIPPENSRTRGAG
jgi:hypothetical protein